MDVELDLAGADRASLAATACRVCGRAELEHFLQVRDLPVNCIALWPTRPEAVECPRGTIDLAFCATCGGVSNAAFDATRLEYDRAYDNSLHFSPTFERYVTELSTYLIERYDLRGKDIIDVGCGNAEFLALVCRQGNNRGVGFDPSFIAGRADMTAGLGITIVQDYYSERYRQRTADIVICRQVLEHIPAPRRFLGSVRAALGGSSKTAVFFEVPNASWIFRSDGIWDIIYEHCSYYTAGALTTLFATCGFDVIKVAEAFDGQYLCVEAQPSETVSGTAAIADGDLGSRDVSQFAERHRSRVGEWDRVLRRLTLEHRRIALWGAGAKGAMFLNAYRHVPGLEYIVDVNPYKWGLHVPGTGQEVVSPAFLKEYRPDVLLIMNSRYREEIGRQVSDLGLTPELIAI